MRKLILFLLFFCFLGNTYGQKLLKVENVYAEEDPENPQQIIISFDIKTPLFVDWFDVEIRCSLDGGKTFGTPLQKVVFKSEKYTGTSPVRGYFRKYNNYNRITYTKPAISHKAYWKVLEEYSSLVNDEIVFEVTVKRDENKIKIQDNELPRTVLVKGGRLIYNDPITEQKDTIVLKDFYMGRYELTTKDYILYKIYNKKVDLKVIDRTSTALCNGTYDLYKGLCKWMGGRFPSFAEWLYAAKGGHKRKNFIYSGGNNIKKVAQIEKDHFRLAIMDDKRPTVPVGQKKPNSLGMYDLNGNASEVVTITRMVRAASEEKKKRRRRKKRNVTPLLKKVEDFYVTGGDMFDAYAKMRLDALYQNLKMFEEVDLKFVGVRLVKDVPRWKGSYTNILASDVRVGQYNTQVTTSSFQLSSHDISNAAYAQFLNFDMALPETYRLSRWIDLKGKYGGQKCRIYFKDGKYLVEAGYENTAVTFVSHLGAKAYAMWRGGRLPTEVELIQARKQKNLNDRQVALWCQDGYQLYFLENLKSGETNPVNIKVTGKHVVNDLQGRRKGYFSKNFYPEVGFRVVLPKE
ncbi:MAG TPA: hypothetical protein DCS93_44150 [Microscillaceae bacterium]|nr:hypothetical protein [Microscillaceae bacterium]